MKKSFFRQKNTKNHSSQNLAPSGKVFVEQLCTTKDKELFFTLTADSTGGKTHLFRYSANRPLNPVITKHNIRSKVFEYGGDAYTVADNATFFFEQNSHTLWIKTEKEIKPLFSDDSLSFANLNYHSQKKRLYMVELDLNKDEYSLCYYDLTSQSLCRHIHTSFDFYSSITLCDNHLAVAAWQHPHMPWQESCIIELELNKHQTVWCYEKTKVSLTYPLYNNNTLFFLSDEPGYWSLSKKSEDNHVVSVIEIGADLCLPPWKLQKPRYFFDKQLIYLIATRNGKDELYIYDQQGHTTTQLSCPLTYIQEAQKIDDTLLIVGSSHAHKYSLYRQESLSDGQVVLKDCLHIGQETRSTSKPVEVSCLNRYGQDVYGIYYPPIDPQIQSPPLIVRPHSGPTIHATYGYNEQAFYFCRHGFGYLDVNYSGSSGYGKKYRERLDGKWGQLDVTDTYDITKHVIEKFNICSQRIALKGSSSAGLTITHLLRTDLYRCACISYGVLDLKDLMTNTHKFERDYTLTLIGQDNLEDSKLNKLNPKTFITEIQQPIYFFHGKKDPVVNYQQSESAYARLKSLNPKCKLLLFSKEGHSFKDPKVCKTVQNQELLFFKEHTN